jgi:hypothetical protein
MCTNENGEHALLLAQAELFYWQERAEAQRTAVEEAQNELNAILTKARTAEDFLKLLQERYGVPAVPSPSTRFERMDLRDAALTVIEERQRISPKDLVVELQAGGFQKFDRYPGRQLHAALLYRHQDKAEKDKAGFWCWKPRTLPLEMKEREGRGEE